MPEITIGASDLTRLVDVCKLSAGKDELLPVFTMLHFTSRNGRLYCESTDRYTMSLCWTDAQNIPDDIDFLAPTKEMVAAMRLFKSRRGIGVPLKLKLTFDATTLTIAVAEGAVELMIVPTVTVMLGDGEFPKVSRLHKEVLELPGDERVPIMHLQREYLARIPAPRWEHRGMPTVIVAGKPGEPMAIGGQDFLVTIMQMRQPGDWSLSDAYKGVL